MVSVCIVRNCRNARRNSRLKGCTTFGLPIDRTLCKQWLINCEREDLQNKSVDILHRYYRVCVEHFIESMFTTSKRIRLLPKAIPTQFMLSYNNTDHDDSKPIVYNFAATNNSSENKLTSMGPPPAIPIPLEEQSTSDIVYYNLKLLNSENKSFPSGHITIDKVYSLANEITDLSSSHKSINTLTLSKQKLSTPTILTYEEERIPCSDLSIYMNIINHDHSYHKSITTHTPSVQKQFTSATLFNSEVEQIPRCSLSMDNSRADVDNKDNSSEKPLITIRNISELIEQTSMKNGEVEHIPHTSLSMDNCRADINNKNSSEKPLILTSKLLELIDQMAASTTRPSSAELKLNIPRNEDDVIKLIEKLEKTNKQNKELTEKCKILSDLVNNKSTDITQFIASVNNFYLMCDIHLLPNLSMVIKENVKSSNLKYNAIRYSDQKKHLAFTVYFYGPRTYNFFKTLLQLPNPITLHKYIQKINIMPGLNDFIFEAIKFKISNLKDDAKDCVLCINKMAIKTHLYYNLSQDYILGFINSYKGNTYEPAKYVLCFTLHSLNYEWKQHVAYFFINNSFTGIHLKNTIFAVISRVQKISLNIKIVTSNEHSNFTSFLNIMCITWERPYFYVNGQKIYCLFDVPYLLKSTRNIFFKYNLKLLNNKIINKVNLVEFYKLDKGLNRFAPELSDMHINPGRFHKKEVKYARQIFSTSVAMGVKHYIKSGILPTSAEPTRQFIDSMDKLLNLLNFEVGYTEFNRQSENTIEQKKFLLTMLEFFKNMRVVDTKMINGKNTIYDITDKIKFLNGWIITISSLLMLWDDMPTRPHVFYTNILNHDCFKDFYRQFRNCNGNYINPTPITFFRTFKKIFFLKYFQYFDGCKSTEDLGEVFISIVNTLNSRSFFSNFSDKSPFCYNLKVDTIDYRELCLSENNSLHYICGYLLEKCIQKHNCDVCLNYAWNQKKINLSFLSSYFKTKHNVCSKVCDLTHENFNKLTDQFFNYIKMLDDIFKYNFPILSIGDHFGKTLKEIIDNVPFTHPCRIFEIQYLKTLYIRLRTFHIINCINKNMLLMNRKNRKIDFLSHFKNI